jgi:hypothetical protein
MNESQWLESNNPRPMLAVLHSRGSDRKLQLFAIACCRRVWHLMTDARHREAVEAAEQFAEGSLTEAEFEAALEPVVALWADLPDARTTEWAPFHYMTGATRHLGPGGGASSAASFAARGLACAAGREGGTQWVAARQVEEAAQCPLIRDLFGNPSRPFRFDSDWLSGQGRVAVERARNYYRQGKCESLSELAELLEQAGYQDRAVLEHCRGPGPHIRGCWVLDALLGHQTAVRTGLVTEADWRTCPDPAPLLHVLRGRGSVRKWRLYAVACCRRIDHLFRDERSYRAIEIAARYADGAATEKEVQAARSAAQQAQEEAAEAAYTEEAESNFCLTPAYAAACCRCGAASAARSTLFRDPRVTDGEPGSYQAKYWHRSDRRAAEAVSKNLYATSGSQPGEPAWEAARRASEAARATEFQAHCDLLRDLFGDYLGPLGGEGEWLPTTPTLGSHGMSGSEQWCLLPTSRDITLRPEWLAWNDGRVGRLARAIYDEEAFDRLPILADYLEEAGCTNVDFLAHCRQGGTHVRGCWVLDRLLGKS